MRTLLLLGLFWTLTPLDCVAACKSCICRFIGGEWACECLVERVIPNGGFHG